jgi:hypothetical protein
VIVLDENLDEQRVCKPLSARYKGNVCSIRELRPRTVIKDDAIPAILTEMGRATFVTTNVADFWRRVPAHPRYCIVCLPLPNERQFEIPVLLFALFRHEALRTRQQRLGKVIRANASEILYYEVGQRQIRRLSW